MSEETLRRFLDQLNTDGAFRDSVGQDPAGAFAQFGLSPAEQAALATNDEDALRRLAGQDVRGYMQNVGPQAPGFLSIISCKTNDFTVCGWWTLCCLTAEEEGCSRRQGNPI